MPLYLRRSVHVAVLVLAAVLAPACSTGKKKTAPAVLFVLPTSTSSGAMPLMPNIVVLFDQAMNPAFMNNGFFELIPAGSSSGILINTEYLPAINEIRIWPQSLLPTNKSYALLVSGLVQAANGTALGSDLILANLTTQTTTTTTSQLSWAGASAMTGTVKPGDIVLTLADILESSAIISPTYQVYVSTASGFEDLLLPAFATITASGMTTITLPSAATTYYVKVLALDGSGAIDPTGFMAGTEITVTSN